MLQPLYQRTFKSNVKIPIASSERLLISWTFDDAPFVIRQYEPTDFVVVGLVGSLCSLSLGLGGSL
jgi:hypothetical protein